MAITLVGSTAAVGNAGSGNSISTVIPTGTVSTDTLIAFVGLAAGGVGTTIATPSGWTLFSGTNLGPDSSGGYVAIFTAPGTVGTAAWSCSAAGTVNGTAEITSWRGVNTGAPITNYSVLADNSAPADHVAPSVVAAAGGAVFAFWFQCQGTSTFGAAASGYTDITLNLPNSTFENYTSSYKTGVSAGATGTISHNTSISFLCSYVGTIALAAAAANDPAASSQSRFANNSRHSFGTRR